MSSTDIGLKISLSLFAAAAFLFLGPAKYSPLVLTTNGRTEYQIVVSPEASEFDLQAAHVLRGYIEKISGAIIPVVTDEAPAKTTEILIGRSRRLADLSATIPFEELGEDGFVLQTAGKVLIIAGGRERGTPYGVYTFLEDYLGCRKYSKEATLVPRRSTIRVGPINRKEVPFFTYREVYMPDAFDDGYADWHKLDNQRVRRSEWGLWVHTFKIFVPPEKYFGDHPEYFTEMNGLRVPDAQLCLTNPAVFKIVVESLRERIKENPEAKYWSVSQNDTFSPCQCPTCRVLDEKYGGPSGTILDFVNRVAREFPDRTISTLAYQYSRQAPTGIKPEKNVNIMLCTIECNRSRPIATDPQNASFTRDIRDWAKLTDNIILWDYVVQFRNYCDPFPNLRVLKPNIHFFKDNGVRLMFQQGSSTSRSEFHELRTYLIAKLLWNPDADVEALTDDFVNGFYGSAAKNIGRYIRLLHDSLEEPAGDLGIYGFPWDGVKTYLRPKLLDKYSRLFDKAESAVAGDPVFLDRVRFARLPVEFAILEIAKRQVTPKYSIFIRDRIRWNVNPAIVKRLDMFVEWANRLKVMQLEESGTPPDVYRREMQDFMAKGMNIHLGFERPTSVLTAYSEKYPVGGAKALTDGLKGTRDYHCNWLGFEGEEMEAIVDLRKPMEIHSISIDFLQNINAWIWVPESVEYSLSDNGQDFTTIGTIERKTEAKAAGDIIEEFRSNFQARPARYVKVKTKSFLHCPLWHKGTGGKSWIFADEIVIN